MDNLAVSATLAQKNQSHLDQSDEIHRTMQINLTARRYIFHRFQINRSVAVVFRNQEKITKLQLLAPPEQQALLPAKTQLRFLFQRLREIQSGCAEDCRAALVAASADTSQLAA